MHIAIRNEAQQSRHLIQPAVIQKITQWHKSKYLSLHPGVIQSQRRQLVFAKKWQNSLMTLWRNIC